MKNGRKFETIGLDNFLNSKSTEQALTPLKEGGNCIFSEIYVRLEIVVPAATKEEVVAVAALIRCGKPGRKPAECTLETEADCGDFHAIGPEASA